MKVIISTISENQEPVQVLQIFEPNALNPNNTFFNSASTTDPNHGIFMTEFDFNDDGIFDSSPSFITEVS